MIVDLDTLNPDDRLRLADDSVVRVVERTPDGDHLPVIYEESRSEVFSDGECNLVYPHEVVSHA